MLVRMILNMISYYYKILPSAQEAENVSIWIHDVDGHKFHVLS
jgi:hypothetical protein